MLSGPTTFYKYPNEDRYVATTISDSDGHDITINVISSIPSGISLDLDTDRIHWSTPNIGTYTLHLRLVDECGAETEVTLTFVVAACQCRNGGTCAPSELDGSNIGSPLCLCPILFSGVLCEIGPDTTISPPAPTSTTTPTPPTTTTPTTTPTPTTTTPPPTTTPTPPTTTTTPTTITTTPTTTTPTSSTTPYPQWGHWGHWGPCEKPCDKVVQYRTRTCQTSGLCTGPSEQKTVCHQVPCPGKQVFTYI